MWFRRTPIDPADLLVASVGSRRAKRLRQQIGPSPTGQHRVGHDLVLRFERPGILSDGTRYLIGNIERRIGIGPRFTFVVDAPLSWEEAIYLAVHYADRIHKIAWDACGTARYAYHPRPKKAP